MTGLEPRPSPPRFDTVVPDTLLRPSAPARLAGPPGQGAMRPSPLSRSAVLQEKRPVCVMEVSIPLAGWDSVHVRCTQCSRSGQPRRLLQVPT